MDKMHLKFIKRIERIEMLQHNINGYKESDDFENAMKCDIRLQTLKLVEFNLREELKD